MYKNKTCLCKPRCRVCNEDGCHICFVFVYFMLCFVLYCIIVFLFLFIFVNVCDQVFVCLVI